MSSSRAGREISEGAYPCALLLLREHTATNTDGGTGQKSRLPLMGPLAADGRRCHVGLGDSLLRSNSGFGCPVQQADVLHRWAQQHRPRWRHSHGAGPWCSARDGSNAAVLERPKTAEAPARLTQTQRQGSTERQAGDAAARMQSPQQLLLLAPKPQARPHAPRAPKRSLALEGSAALTSLMLARALGTTIEQVMATHRCCAELSHTAAPSREQQTTLYYRRCRLFAT